MDRTDWSIEDLDSILGVWIAEEDARESFTGVEAIAVRAIVALSLSNNPKKARELFLELRDERKSADRGGRHSE
jgi:hypothetical protein